MPQGRLHQINVAPAGGVPKLAIEATRIEIDHVAGDRQRNLKLHGGPMRAVCLFSIERIAALQAEGHSILPGKAGENLTLAGVDWNDIAPGTRLAIGNKVQLEITEFTRPCNAIADCFAGRQIKRMSQADHPGWARVYAKVLRPGTVRRGDRVAVTAATTLFDLP